MTRIDPGTFRKVLGHFPTGVTVVTGVDPAGAPQGLTIGSFASVSLDPPLVAFFPGAGSLSWPAILPSGRFCVNVLGADQAELCWRFAREADDRFDGVEWVPSPGGCPILPGVVAWVDCTLERADPAGDHAFVLGRVNDLAHADEVDDAMVFFRGKVGGIVLHD